MFAGITPEQARWKPNPEKWSLLEIVNHLYDEECEDFRTRVQMTLEDPSRQWPMIDPQGWVTKRAYGDRELGESIERFAAARKESLAWLRSLDEGGNSSEALPWDNAYQHPDIGPLRAGDLMLSWLEHDYLHMRQVAGLMYQFAETLAEGYSPKYAGGL
jgi:hypothetical protein